MKLFDTQSFTKKFSVFFPIVFCCLLFSASAQVVIVPSANTNDASTRQPYGCFYGYERTEALYLNSEFLGTTGTITQVGFYVNAVTNPTAITPVVIRMKTTGATTVSSDTYDNASAGATTVWSGHITSGMLSANSWVTVTLSTPFTYSSNNLDVFVEMNFGSFGDETDTAKQFRNSNTAGNLCQIWYEDDVIPTDLGTPLSFRPNIQLNFVTSCSGTPSPGNTLATSDTVCSGSQFTLSIQNALGGETYQWKANGSNISGETNATYTGSQIATTTYHCAVTCTSSGQSANSTDLVVTLQSFYHCYCASYAVTTEDTKIDSVHLGTINTGSDPSLCQSYTDYTGGNIPTLNPGQPNIIHIVNGSCTGEAYEAYVSIYIDYNHVSGFTAAELVYSYGPIGVLNGIPDLTFFVPPTALSGTTGMRIVLQEGGSAPSACGTYTRGETEDYLVNISAVSACSGTPPADSTLSTKYSVCPGELFTLSLQTYPSASGITYQWQKCSTLGGSYTNISGATTYTVTYSQSDSLFYRCKITCTNSGQITYSFPILVDMNPVYECYCPSGAISISNDTKIDTVQFGSINAGSAPDHCESYTNNTAFSTDLDPGSAVPIHIVNGSCDGQFYEAYLAVYIDYDQSGVYDPDELAYSFGPTTGLNSINPVGNINVPLIGTTPGLTGMRVILKEDSVPDPCGLYLAGETEDYVVNIGVVTACIDPPTPGITVVSPDTLCSSVLPATVSLSLDNNTTGLGQTYQWQDSTVGGNWLNIPGATSSTAIATISLGDPTTYYRCKETCGAHTLPSAEAVVIVKPAPTGNTIGEPIVVTGFPYVDINNNFSVNCWTKDYTGLLAQPSPDVYYQVMTGNVVGELVVSTCNTTDLNTYIHIFKSNGTDSVYHGDDFGNVCLGSIYASDSFHTSASEAYYWVIVQGSGSAQGNFQLNLNFITATNLNTIVSSSGQISLFPNPNSGAFDLSLDLKQNINDVATVSITNVIGQLIDEMKVPVINGKLSKEISLTNRADDGLYFVNIRMNDRSLNQRFIIQH